MEMRNMCAKFHGVDIGIFVRKTCVFCVVIFNYFVLVQDRVLLIFAINTDAQIRAQCGRCFISTSASSLILGQHTDVRKVGVLDEAGGLSTIVVFKLRTSMLSANIAGLIWYIITSLIFCLSHTLRGGIRRGGLTPALAPRMPVSTEDVLHVLQVKNRRSL